MIFISLIALVFIVAACGSEKGAEGDSPKKVSGIVPLYSPDSGGTNYVISAGISQIFNSSKVMPEVLLSTESISGSTQIISSVIDRYEQGKPAFGAPASDIATYIYNGEYEPLPGEHKELRAVTWFNYAAVHVVVPEKSSIQSLADLKGKKIGVAPKGSSPYNFMESLLRGGYDLSIEKDLKAIPLGNSEINEGLQNGSIDAGILTGFIPAPLVKEISQLDSVRIISFEKDILAEFIANNPYYSAMDVKAGTYRNQDEDITIGAFETLLLTHEDVDEELVYNLTKFILENESELKKIHEAFSISPDNVSRGVEIPFHSGAEKYFKEKGISYEK